MSNNTNIKNLSQEGMNLAAEVHEVVLHNAIISCVLENHLSILCDEIYFPAFENCVYLLGLNFRTIDEEILNSLLQVILKFPISRDGNINEVLSLTADQILAEWKTLLF